MKFAVCDDECEMTDYISDRLREYYPEECEIRKYEDGESLLADSGLEFFDAFFLDIGMPGLDGMKLAEKLRENNRNVKIVFVTKNEELAHKGYMYNAFRYVRKSALEQELREAAKSLSECFSLTDSYMNFRTPNGEIIIGVKSIRYFEVKGHDITVVCDESREQVYGTMNGYEKCLRNMGFIRIHKSYLVNLRCIYCIKNKTVKLSCGKELPLSRNRADETKKRLLAFSRNVEI